MSRQRVEGNDISEGRRARNRGERLGIAGRYRRGVERGVLSAASGGIRCVGVVEGVGIALAERAVIAGRRENLRRSIRQEVVDKCCPGRCGDGRWVDPGLGGGCEG